MFIRKGDYMKRLFIAVLLALLLAGCQNHSKETDTSARNSVSSGIGTSAEDNFSTEDSILTEDNISSEDSITAEDNLFTGSKGNYSYSQNDLVYHDYGTGIELSANSTLMIRQLNLDLDNENAVICAVDLKNNETIQLYDYEPNQDISFTPASDGVYKIIAETSNGEIIDLMSKAVIETTYMNDTANGFIPLK